MADRGIRAFTVILEAQAFLALIVMAGLLIQLAQGSGVTNRSGVALLYIDLAWLYSIQSASGSLPRQQAPSYR
jgi:hypothetical protein